MNEEKNRFGNLSEIWGTAISAVIGQIELDNPKHRDLYQAGALILRDLEKSQISVKKTIFLEKTLALVNAINALGYSLQEFEKTTQEEWESEAFKLACIFIFVKFEMAELQNSWKVFMATRIQPGEEIQ